MVAAVAAGTESLAAPPELSLLQERATACTRCRLAETRTQVVFGSGSPQAPLMFVGEAPGFHEDKNGVPFVGAAGKLLERLLGEIGLARQDVYIANVLKCRPPGNRDPQPDEIESCSEWLLGQIALIRPTLICTLGNFATKLLSNKPDGITRVHGVPQDVTLGGMPVRLFPIYHPAAALYTPAMLKVLEEDFRKLPGLLAAAGVVLAAPVAAPPAAAPAAVAAPLAPATAAAAGAPAADTGQLGLF